MRRLNTARRIAFSGRKSDPDFGFEILDLGLLEQRAESTAHSKHSDEVSGVLPEADRRPNKRAVNSKKKLFK